MTAKLPAAIELLRFTDRQHCAEAVAAHVAAALALDIADHGTASLAVSGGSTPAPMFKTLSRLDLGWDKVAVTLADERWVSPDHADSNQAKVQQLLLQNDAAAANYIPLWNNHSDGAADAAALAETEQALQQLPEKLSCVILGMGNDGHTASLFPCSSELASLWDAESAAAWCQPTTAPHQRITLTPQRLFASKERILHLNGLDKLETLMKALAGTDVSEMPIRAFLNQPITVFWAP